MDKITNTKVSASDIEKYNKGINNFNKIDKSKYINKVYKSYKEVTPDDQVWLDVLSQIAGERGLAIKTLTNYLLDKGHSYKVLSGVALANELLEGLSDEECQSITTLLSDGWSQGIGSLLSCAKKL